MAAEKDEKSIAQRILRVEGLRRSDNLVELNKALLDLKQALKDEMVKISPNEPNRKNQMEKLAGEIGKVNNELAELEQKLPLRNRSHANAPLPDKVSTVTTLPASKWKNFSDRFKSGVTEAAGRVGYQVAKVIDKTGKMEDFKPDDPDVNGADIMKELEEMTKSERSPAKTRNSRGDEPPSPPPKLSR